jgi:hypothetical protein
MISKTRYRFTQSCGRSKVARASATSGSLSASSSHRSVSSVPGAGPCRLAVDDDRQLRETHANLEGLELNNRVLAPLHTVRRVLVHAAVDVDVSKRIPLELANAVQSRQKPLRLLEDINASAEVLEGPGFEEELRASLHHSKTRRRHELGQIVEIGGLALQADTPARRWLFGAACVIVHSLPRANGTPMGRQVRRFRGGAGEPLGPIPHGSARRGFPRT